MVDKLQVFFLSSYRHLSSAYGIEPSEHANAEIHNALEINQLVDHLEMMGMKLGELIWYAHRSKHFTQGRRQDLCRRERRRSPGELALRAAAGRKV
eukprot:COSAG02_NODE_5151_length_4588_cov_2.905324_5_plen_96_part_00